MSGTMFCSQAFETHNRNFKEISQHSPQKSEGGFPPTPWVRSTALRKPAPQWGLPQSEAEDS